MFSKRKLAFQKIRNIRKFNTVSTQIYKPRVLDLPQKYKSPYVSLLGKYEMSRPTEQTEKIETVFRAVGNALGFKVNQRTKSDEFEAIQRKEDLTQSYTNNLRMHLVQKAIKTTSAYDGDGSYTATILAAAMTSLVIKSLEEGSDPKALKKGISYGVEIACKYLNEVSSPIVVPNELDQITKTVTNGDIPLAEAVTDAFVEVGRDGWIEVEESKTGFDHLEKIKGIKIDSGYVSPVFNNDGNKVLYHEIYVLLSEDVLSTKKCILPAVTAATKERYPLLILAKGFDDEALQTLIKCRQQDKMRICAVKTPDLDEFGKRLLLDVAISCEATVFSDQSLKMLEEIRPKQHFGLAWSADITKNRTIITSKASVRTNNGRIRRKIRDLKSKIMLEENPQEKEYLRERLARFVQRMAVVKVGGKNEEEIKERCKIARKAISSLRAALEEGAVPGGGCALVKCLGFPQFTRITDDFHKGLDIVSRSLWVPCMVIAKNAGLNPTELAFRVYELSADVGFDMCTKRFVNMFHEGILDPTRVLTSGLAFAADVTKSLTNEFLAKQSEQKN